MQWKTTVMVAIWTMVKDGSILGYQTDLCVEKGAMTGQIYLYIILQHNIPNKDRSHCKTIECP